MGYQLSKFLVRINHQHQTSSACQSITAVGGTILAFLGGNTVPTVTSVVLLMNTMYLSTGHHHPVLHHLWRYHMTPLVSALLWKTTVTGIVSSAVLSYSLCGSIHNVVSLDCTAWTLCFEWYCGTIYEKEEMMAGPPPPCPPPPANFTPPARPGECRFNVPSQQCKFFPNTTGKLEIDCDLV